MLQHRIFQIYFVFLVRISHLLTGGKQHPAQKSPLSGIAVYLKKLLLCRTNLKSRNMKMIADSIRHFFEGFTSFYTSFYDEMKRW
jgi:hypothetical protein